MQKLRLPPLQWLFITTLLTTCSHAKPCTCTSSSNEQQEYRKVSYTWNTEFEQMDQGLLFLFGKSSITLQPGSLGYYIGNCSNLSFNLTDSGWFVIPKWFDPWKRSHDDDRIDFHEAVSFSIIFTLSAASGSVLQFDILPRLEPAQVVPNHYFSNSPVQISILNSTTSNSGRTVQVQTMFDPTGENGPNPVEYRVHIDYDRVLNNLSGYLVRDAGTDVPFQETVYLDAADALSPDALLFAISAPMEQLLQLHTWNFTIELEVPVPQAQTPTQRTNTVTIVSSVLGSATATAAIAAAVYLYLNSKYRRWKKDLDRLTKTMRSLPGVPTQVDYADIKKATNDFHETMRLGQGGFGAVYKCKLPAPSKGEEAMEVAVKKFTHSGNRGYEDFLAEVSIINRLRHKNIVPLIGWSYNRGDPILIYEYMPNASLDQHLFRRCRDEHQQPTCIGQWGTRYNIVKDIAAGLQYVHHEYEPMVLHRDIKASNVMIDSTFQGRLGDFGLACVLADGKNSYTDQGAPGTIGFRAPEYVYCGKATRKTDIFAFGVLVLEIVTGKRAVGRDVEFGHITDWVWQLHAEGNLLAAVDTMLTTTEEFNAQEATRLLQLGMACSNPNPSDRPSMVDVVQIISKSVPPPDIPLSKPPLVWPPQEWESSLTSDRSTSTSNFNTTSTFMVETAGGERISTENEGVRFTSYPSRGRRSSQVVSVYHSARETAT